MNRSLWLVLAVLAFQAGAADKKGGPIKLYSAARKGYVTMEKVIKTDAEWKKILTPEQFEIMRDKGTEKMCSGAFWKHKEAGLYRCAACGNDLFQSEKKFDSESGWPSFWGAVNEANITKHEDRAFGMIRTEVRCARCDSHLGHIFEDGPKPSGLRYCINSIVLNFIPAGKVGKDNRN